MVVVDGSTGVVVGFGFGKGIVVAACMRAAFDLFFHFEVGCLCSRCSVVAGRSGYRQVWGGLLEDFWD